MIFDPMARFRTQQFRDDGNLTDHTEYKSWCEGKSLDDLTPWAKEETILKAGIDRIKKGDLDTPLFLHMKHFSPNLGNCKDFVMGYVECLYLPTAEQLLCNEDGNRLELPINLHASEYAGQAIVGNVLILCGKARLT